MNNNRFLGFAIIFAAVLICIGLIVGGFLIRSASPPANTVKVDIPEGLVDDGSGRFIAVMGPDRVVYLDQDGRIHEIAMPKDKPPYIRDVYTIIHSPRRHAGNPEKRSPHGYYIDTASGERAARIDHSRRKFLDAAGALDTRIALDIAEELADLGEHAFLLDQLETKAFAGRRAAALVLGKSGYEQSVPILIDLLGDENIEMRNPAYNYLKKITGKDFVEDIKIEVQHQAVKKYTEWWENYKASGVERRASGVEKKESKN